MSLVLSVPWGYRIRICRSLLISVLHEIVDAKGIPHSLGYAGRVDLTATAKLELLHPFDVASTNLHDRDINNDSLVLKLTYGDVRILFTGDIGRKVELKLVESGVDLEAEIVKVPHHGSKTSSSAEFLDAVRPPIRNFFTRSTESIPLSL